MVKRSGTAVAVAKAQGAQTLAAGEGEDTKFKTEGFVTIKIGDKKFELRGIVGAHLIVSYHEPFETAPGLGKITEIAGAVASALGAGDADAFSKDLEAKITALGNTPGLKTVADFLNNALIRVTDLGINTQTGEYQFGFGVDLAGKGVGVGGVTLEAFGLLFTYTASPKPE